MKRKSMCFDLILRTKSKNKNKSKKDRSSSVFCSIWNEKPQYLIFFLFSCSSLDFVP